jgi:hypothetical protein
MKGLGMPWGVAQLHLPPLSEYGPDLEAALAQFAEIAATLSPESEERK